MIRDIMVHLDGSSEDEARLAHAAAVAVASRTHLIGLFTNLLPDITVAMPMDGGAAAVQVLTELEARARQDGDAVARRLADRLAGLQMPAELRRIDGTLGTLSGRVTEEARCADLFIATRPYGQSDAPAWPDLVEDVLFGSGRALLLVPPGAHRHGPFETVLVTWNGSREAARALREGMSFIEQATRTVVLVVDPDPEAKPWADVERHLLRHGVTAEISRVESDSRRVADLVLDEARAVAADLIVMGGYGHTRIRERVFGGVTMDMLTESEQPILVAH